MKDNLNFLANGRRPQFFQVEDNLNFFNERRPKYSCEWKTTSDSFKWRTTLIFLKSEDELNKNNAT